MSTLEIPAPAPFVVGRGRCGISGDCVTSPNYPKPLYGGEGNCIISVSKAGTLKVKLFDLYHMSMSGMTFADKFVVGSKAYDAKGSPDGVSVVACTTIQWKHHSMSQYKKGWKLCLDSPPKCQSLTGCLWLGEPSVA